MTTVSAVLKTALELDLPWGELDARYAPLQHSHPPHIHEPELSNAVVVAAANWPWKSGAHFICDGIDDDVELNQALDAAKVAGGAKVVPTGGIFNLSNPVFSRGDLTKLEGFGAATMFSPTPQFPTGEYLLSIYRDNISPVSRAYVSNLYLRGNGVVMQEKVHGLRFCSYRGHLRDLWISRLSGDGLYVHNAAEGTGDSWNSYESTISHFNIVGCGGVGARVNSTDQHWTDGQFGSNAEGSLHGILTGTMLTAVHCFGGAENWKNQQTQVNVDLRISSRCSWVNSKIEHAARELVRMRADPKGGHIRWNVGFRNGCSDNPIGADGKPIPTYSQILVTGPSFFGAIWHDCRFDKDAAGSLPKHNIEIVGDSLRGARINGCEFNGSALEPVNKLGTRCLMNDLGITDQDPNLGGAWKGFGEWGIRVRDSNTKRIWTAINKDLWE